jgi:WD40 repeat protein
VPPGQGGSTTNQQFPGAGEPGPYVYVWSNNAAIGTHLDVFAAQTGDLVTSFVIPCESNVGVADMRFNNDRSKLYLSIGDGSIDVVNTTTNVLSTIVPSQTNFIGFFGGLVLSPDNKYVYDLGLVEPAAGGAPRTLRKYDATTGALIGANSTVSAFVQGPIAVNGVDGTIYAESPFNPGINSTAFIDEFDGSTLAHVGTLNVPQYAAGIGAIDSTSTHLFMLAAEPTDPIDEIAIGTGAIVKQFNASDAGGSTNQIALSPEDKRLYVAGARIDVIDTQSGAEIKQLPQQGLTYDGIALNAAGSRAFLTKVDTHVYGFDTSTFVMMTPFNAPFKQEAYGGILAQ